MDESMCVWRTRVRRGSDSTDSVYESCLTHKSHFLIGFHLTEYPGIYRQCTGGPVVWVDVLTRKRSGFVETQVSELAPGPGVRENPDGRRKGGR